MRKTLRQISIILLLIIATGCAIYSQTPVSPTVVGKGETVSFLIEQNSNARELIAAQNKRIGDLENELVVERENSASFSKSYAAAASEINSLKTSNAALLKAVALNEQTVALLQTDNAKQREKAKKATREKWKAYAVAAATVAATVLLR